MDCDKIAKIYLRSCYAEKSRFYIETFTEQYLREIAKQVAKPTKDELKALIIEYRSKLNLVKKKFN